MRLCPICHKEDFVIVIKTEVGKRRYRCQRCNKEWEAKPTYKERENFNG